MVAVSPGGRTISGVDLSPGPLTLSTLTAAAHMVVALAVSGISSWTSRTCGAPSGGWGWCGSRRSWARALRTIRIESHPPPGGTDAPGEIAPLDRPAGSQGAAALRDDAAIRHPAGASTTGYNGGRSDRSGTHDGKCGGPVAERRYGLPGDARRHRRRDAQHWLDHLHLRPRSGRGPLHRRARACGAAWRDGTRADRRRGCALQPSADHENVARAWHHRRPVPDATSHCPTRMSTCAITAS